MPSFGYRLSSAGRERLAVEFRARSDIAGKSDSSFVARTKGMSNALLKRYEQERSRAPFASLRDFHQRVNPTNAEMLSLIRVGAFDSFGEPRTSQIWHLQYLAQWPEEQGFLFQTSDACKLPPTSLTEPNTAQKLRDEMNLLGFTVFGHPLDQYNDVSGRLETDAVDASRSCSSSTRAAAG